MLHKAELNTDYRAQGIQDRDSTSSVCSRARVIAVRAGCRHQHEGFWLKTSENSGYYGLDLSNVKMIDQDIQRQV